MEAAPGGFAASAGGNSDFDDAGGFRDRNVIRGELLNLEASSQQSGQRRPARIAAPKTEALSASRLGPGNSQRVKSN